MTRGEFPSVPRAAVGVVVIDGDKVLLIKRARPPRAGRWALPGGGVNLGETLQEAAEREVAEETGVTVRARRPIHSFDIITRDDDGHVRFHYVIVDLVADYIGGEPRPGDDVSDAGWFKRGVISAMDLDSDTLALLQHWDEWRTAP
jgi:8-oxo-dGTP diphosphatase